MVCVNVRLPSCANTIAMAQHPHCSSFLERQELLQRHAAQCPIADDDWAYMPLRILRFHDAVTEVLPGAKGLGQEVLLGIAHMQLIEKCTSGEWALHQLYWIRKYCTKTKVFGELRKIREDSSPPKQIQ